MKKSDIQWQALIQRILNLGLVSTLVVVTAAEALAGEKEAKETRKGGSATSAHSREYQSGTEDEGDDEGQSLFVELGSGMHYWDEGSGDWAPSDPVFELRQDGTAVADRVLHKIRIKPRPADPGAVEIQAHGEKPVRCHILGLALFDPATGRSELAGPAQNGEGELLLPERSRLLFRNSFENVRAHILYELTADRFSQDVILDEPIDVAGFGFDPETAHLEIWTEFDKAAQPRVQPRFGRKSTAPDEALVWDQTIAFGDFVLGPGRCFRLGDAGAPNAVPVAKSWQEIGPRKFLVESVRWKEVELLFRREAAQAVAGEMSGFARAADAPRELPKGSARFARAGEPIRLAKWDPQPSAVCVDFSGVSALSSLKLQARTTYYINSPAVVAGPLTIEPGAVVKFGPYSMAGLLVYGGQVMCQTTMHEPAVFTTINDDTVGDRLSHVFGAPGLIQAGYPALGIGENGVELSHLRFRSSRVGAMYLEGTYGHRLKHAQFIGCETAIELSGLDSLGLQEGLYAGNVLITGAGAAFRSGGGAVRLEHGTIRDCGAVGWCASGKSFLNLVNTIVAGVGTRGVPYNSESASVELPDPRAAFIEQPFGRCYLGLNSPYRNAGSRAIDPVLAKEFAATTTTPPRKIENQTVSGSLRLTRGTRDDDGFPDLGYHYPAVDYTVKGLVVRAPGGVLMSEGTILALAGSPPIEIEAGARFVSVGSPYRRNAIVPMTLVGETIESAGTKSIVFIPSAGVPAVGEFRFTDFIRTARAEIQIEVGSGASVDLGMADCAGFNGTFLAWGTAAGKARLFNNRFHVCNQTWMSAVVVDWKNNLFMRGNFRLMPSSAVVPEWVIENNVFDGTAFRAWAGFQHGYNAYLASAVRLQPLAGTDVLTAGFEYASGPLGDHYQAGHLLVDRGSRSAEALGLYHSTTQVSQHREANSQVDIGFHYPAVGTFAMKELPKSKMTALGSSELREWIAANVLNGSSADPGWQNQSTAETAPWLRIDLGSSQLVTRIEYLPRVGAGQGTFLGYRLYVTDSSLLTSPAWGAPVSSGTWEWPVGQERKTLEPPAPVRGRFVIFSPVSGKGGYASANEVALFTGPAATSGTSLSDANGNGVPDHSEDLNGDGRLDAGDDLIDLDRDGISDLRDVQPLDPDRGSFQVTILSPFSGVLN